MNHAENFANQIVSVIDDIAVAALSVNLFYGSMPPTPANIMVVLLTGGTSAPSGFPDYDDPSIQVIVRDASYDNAIAKATKVRDALHETAFATDDVTYLSVGLVGSVNALGQDENDRFVVSLNFNTLSERKD